MRVRHEVFRKVTVSLPAELVDFADRQAIQHRSNRSKIISLALAEVKSRDEERLAAEGYRFYAQEAELFAASSTRTIPPQPYPFLVVIQPEESGLPEPSAVNCAQIATIQQSGDASRLRPPRGSTVVQPIGRLRADKLVEVENALRYNLGLGR